MELKPITYQEEYRCGHAPNGTERVLLTIDSNTGKAVCTEADKCEFACEIRVNIEQPTQGNRQ